VRCGTEEPRASLWTAVGRGARRRCPHCGRGRLFRSFISVRPGCEVCGYAFEGAQGDTWGFWIVGDRLFILVPMVLLYFGFTPLAVSRRLLFLAAVAVPLIATMPHRLGICIALDYVARARWS